jgi:hypothetical protein
MYVYLEKGIQTPMARDRSTKIILMIKWIRTSRLSIKNSLSLRSLAQSLTYPYALWYKPCPVQSTSSALTALRSLVQRLTNLDAPWYKG